MYSGYFAIRARKIKLVTICIVSAFSLYVFIGNLIIHSGNYSTGEHILAAFVPKINLGLDLRGGSQLVLGVDFKPLFEEKYQILSQEIKVLLVKNDIYGSKVEMLNDFSMFVKPVGVVDDARKSKIYQIVRDLDPSLSVAEKDGGFVMFYDKNYIASVENLVIEKSLKIIRKRIDNNAVKEISLQRSGASKIILQVPGLDDPAQIKRMLGKTAKLSFHLMDPAQPFSNKPFDYVRPEQMVLVSFNGRSGYYKMFKKPEITGDMLLDARADSSNFKPSINFKLNAAGAARFAQITADNIGKPFAIVLDNKVLTTPVINESIPGGSGIISGSFGTAEAKELADMLRSGSLPAPLRVLEERTVGPSSGDYAIFVAKIGSAVGVFAVMLFMLVFYKSLGVIASIAIILNLSMAVTIMCVFGVTLTLSGIAALILTLGMSVDSNVLIYERMRDEIKLGSKSNDTIVNQGFSGAWSAILDSNITTILSAITLVAFGSGFIRGFAMSLIIGLLCSLFSAIVVTKALIEVLVRYRRGKTLVI